MNKPKVSDWKKEFDKRFSTFDGSQDIIKHVTYSAWIKSFISQEIHTAQMELLEKIERLRKELTLVSTEEILVQLKQSLQDKELEK